MSITSNTQTLLETPIPAELQRFCIEEHEDILRILHGLIRDGSQVTAFFKAGQQQLQLPSRLLDIDTERNQLFLDISQDDKTNKALLNAERATIIGKYQQIKYRFATSQISLSRLYGEAAFVTELPKSLFWLQRRNFFRIKPAQHKPLLGMAITPEGKPTEFRVRDISIGGLGLVEPDWMKDSPLNSGDVLKNCHISLGAHIDIQCDIEVKNRWAYTNPKGVRSHHVGTEFLNIPSQTRMELQRYIFRQEITRHQHQMLN